MDVNKNIMPMWGATSVGLVFSAFYWCNEGGAGSVVGIFLLMLQRMNALLDNTISYHDSTCLDSCLAYPCPCPCLRQVTGHPSHTCHTCQIGSCRLTPHIHCCPSPLMGTECSSCHPGCLWCSRQGAGYSPDKLVWSPMVQHARQVDAV
jgi:hypothetical protein